MSASRSRRWLDAFTIRTLAVNIALIATIFLTRNRWAAWVVERVSSQPIFFCPQATPDGRRVVMHERHTVVIWNVESEEVFHFRPEGYLARSIISPGGGTAVIEQVPQYLGKSKDQVRDRTFWRYPPPLLIDLEKGVLRTTLTSRIWSIAYSPDGGRIVTAGEDATARVWGTRSGDELLVLRGHAGPVYSAAWSADGSQIVTAGADRTARIWSAQTGEVLTLLAGHEGPVGSVKLAAGGRRVIAWCYDDKACHIRDAETGAHVALLEGAFSCICSPDGATLLTTNHDETVARIWEARTGGHVAAFTLRGHGGSFPSWIRYSPDGQRIMTYGADRTVKVWSAETGAQLFVLPDAACDETETVWKAKFTPDASRIVTEGCRYAGWIGRVWDAVTGKMLAAFEGARTCVVLQNNRILACRENDLPETQIRRRIRPEQWWGVFCLWHFWLIVVLSIALAVSIRRDVRSLRRR